MTHQRMTLKPNAVDANVARAGTVDPRLSFDPALHVAAIERVFAPSWQIIPVHGDAAAIEPLTLLEGGLDEPLVLTRAEGRDRLLSNVCTHRGALLAECPSEASGLRCRYHGRRFALDGTMTSCPGFEGAADFPRASDDLTELPIETVGPLRFTSIRHDTAASFGEWSAPLALALREFEGEALRYDPAGEHAFELDASWAVYCENYLEGFHVPFVHPELNKALDFSRYRTELEPHAVRQLGFASGDEPRLRHAREADLIAEYLWLYPNLMVNVYPWGISVNVVEPTGPGTTRVRYLRWIARRELLDVGAGSGLDVVEREDQEIVLSVQRGIRSRLYPGGRFSPEHETGPHHFHRMLQRDLSSAGSVDEA